MDQDTKPAVPQDMALALAQPPPEDAALNSRALMEIVRNHPVIYDKSVPVANRPDNKSRSWKMVATEIGHDVVSCQRRYAAVRTNFSKTLRECRDMGAMSYGPTGAEGVVLKRDYEHLAWLVPHIKPRIPPHSAASAAVTPPSPAREGFGAIGMAAAEQADGRGAMQEAFEEDPSLSALGSTAATLRYCGPQAKKRAGGDSGVLASVRLSSEDDDSLLEGRGNGGAPAAADGYVAVWPESLNRSLAGPSATAAPPSTFGAKRPREDPSESELLLKKTAESVEKLRREVQERSPEADEDWAFCMTLLPKLRRIPAQHKCELQLNVLQAVMQTERAVAAKIRAEGRQYPGPSGNY